MTATRRRADILLPMTSLLIPLAESGAGARPWIIGAVILGIWLFLVLAMLSFGGGREHS